MVDMQFDIQTILIIIGFAIGMFILYKVLKLLFKMMVFVILGFAFPWIFNFASEYLNLGIQLDASIEGGINFAIIAAVLFLIFTFLSYIIWALKFVWAIIRGLFGKSDKEEINDLKKELKEIKEKSKTPEEKEEE